MTGGLLTHLTDLGLERFAPALARAGVGTVADLLAGDTKRLRDLVDPESGARVLPVGPYSKLKASVEKLRDQAPRPVSPPQEASKRAPAPPPAAEAPKSKPKKKEKRPAAPTTPADSEASALRSRVAVHENTIKQLRKANEKLRATEAQAAKLRAEAATADSAETTKLLRRVSDQEKTIRQLQEYKGAATKATLRDQLEAARSALDALSTENAKLRDENAILRDDNISLRRTRTKRAREKEELDAELACLKELLDELRAREASGAADEPEAAARTVTPGAPVMDCDEAASALEGYAGSMPSPPTRGGGAP